MQTLLWKFTSASQLGEIPLAWIESTFWVVPSHFWFNFYVQHHSLTEVRNISAHGSKLFRLNPFSCFHCMTQIRWIGSFMSCPTRSQEILTSNARVYTLIETSTYLLWELKGTLWISKPSYFKVVSETISPWESSCQNIFLF